MAVDDEQGVVDPHGQAEHEGEHGGDAVHLDEPGEGEGDADAHPHSHHGHDQRQPRGDQGAEHQHQHDRRDEQTHDLRRAEDLRDVLDDLLAEIHRDTGVRDGFGRHLEFLAEFRRHGIDLLLELHTRHGGGVVLGHEPDARRRLESALRKRQGCAALVELGAAGLEFGPAGVELRLGGCELVLGGLRLLRREERAPLLEGFPLRVELLLALPELRFAVGELLSAGVQLGAPGLQLGAAAFDLRCDVERIHNRADAVERRHLRQSCPDGGLLVGGEGAVVGGKHHSAGASNGLGKFSPQTVGDALRLGAGDGEVVGQGPGERDGGAADGEDDGQPGRDHPPAPAVRELAEPVEQKCHDASLLVGAGNGGSVRRGSRSRRGAVRGRGRSGLRGRRRRRRRARGSPPPSPAWPPWCTRAPSRRVL